MAAVVPPTLLTADDHILVVESDASSRDLLTRMLRKADHVVHEASDCGEALRVLYDRQPRILLSDWNLPGTDGVEMCRRVREDPLLQPLYIIMLTNRDSKQDVAAALDAGADDYLVKPYDSRELLARIRVGFRIVELQKSLEARNEDFQRVNRRLNDELASVSRIQRALLPQKPPQTGNIDFTAFYLPSSECGGDYYDFIPLSDRRLGFVIADVSGHGAPAMVSMAILRQNLHLIAPRYDEPHELLEEMNRLLYDHLPTEQFATMLYAIFHHDNHACTYASAGHTPPLLFQRAGGRVAPLENCEGFPLKLITRDARYRSTTIDLESGDMLFLFTDGIPECFNPRRETYGLERLQEIIERDAPGSSALEMETAIITDLMRFADTRPTDDDVTLAILGVR